jgi:cellulose biosynthesis protein BcsQ
MEKPVPVRFDDSLQALLSSLGEQLGDAVLGATVVVRDVSGRLAAFVDADLSDERIESVAAAIRQRLGAYARTDRILAGREAPGAERILAEAKTAATPIRVSDHLAARLLDRRVAAVDWLAAPVTQAAGPPRLVFASLKGGVGRSTALAVTAAEQARQDRNVLAIDLDLEAPGVSAMLLQEERRPRFGALDFLVENGIGGIDDGALDDFVGTSGLTAGRGLVHVVPASGLVSVDHPGNYLPKLARALIEDMTEDGMKPLRVQIAELVERFTARRDYDIVLIDARAGLAELAAGPVLGLGATVLLFGTPQRQTIEGYRYLLATLSQFAQAGGDLSWRERLKVVLTKTPLDEAIIESFADDMHELFAETLYDEAEATELEAFNFEPGDREAPHFPLVIPFDERFITWDPTRRPTDLTHAFYEATFKPFLQFVEGIVENA